MQHIQKAYRRIRIANDEDVEKLYPLIVAYIQEPSLADAVKEVILDPPSCSWTARLTPSTENSDVSESPVQDGVYAAIRDRVRKLGMDDKFTETMIRHLEWKHAYHQGQLYGQRVYYSLQTKQFGLAASILLLSMCKNINMLGLGNNIPEPLREYLLKSNYGLLSETGLQKLEEVVFVPDLGLDLDERCYEPVEFLDYFRYFHRLTAIRSISMEGVQEHYANRETFVPQTSNIKSIHIGHCDISGDMLSTIIRIPKNLEGLSISMGGLWDVELCGGPHVLPKSIGKALLQHKDSLTTLKLDFSPSHHDEGEHIRPEDDKSLDDDREDPDLNEYFHLDKAISDSPLWTQDLPASRKYGTCIGSLHDFTALKLLQIGVRTLIDVSSKNKSCSELRLINMLPTNLETLILTGYQKGRNGDIDHQVNEFMEQKAERFPSLNIEGIDSMIMDVATEFSKCEQMSEDELWKRPEVEWDWIEA